MIAYPFILQFQNTIIDYEKAFDREVDITKPPGHCGATPASPSPRAGSDRPAIIFENLLQLFSYNPERDAGAVPPAASSGPERAPLSDWLRGDP
jgi:hypothetical protein